MLGEKLRRNKEILKHLPTQLTTEIEIAALIYPGSQRGLRVGLLPAGIYPQLGEFHSKATIERRTPKH